jgi:hypothetical protein
MKWLILLAGAFVWIVHIVALLPPAEAQFPQIKTKLQGQDLKLPSTASFEIRVRLLYRKHLLNYHELPYKTIRFSLLDTEKTPEVLGQSETDNNGVAVFSFTPPQVEKKYRVLAEFLGDEDFKACEVLVQIQRLNIVPELRLHPVQIDNLNVFLEWEGTDAEGGELEYRSVLDRPHHVDTFQWSDWGTATQQRFQNLKPGKYQFKVQARDPFKQESRKETIAFEVVEKTVLLRVVNDTSQEPPFTVKKGVPFFLRASLEEEGKEKPASLRWHCYRGRYQENHYTCFVGGIEDFIVLEEPLSGKVLLFQIQVEE